MRLRVLPRSLIGQLVLAVAVALFVAQSINLVLLVRGQRQEQLAHGGGMAVARIIDALGDPAQPRARAARLLSERMALSDGRLDARDRNWFISSELQPLPDGAAEWPAMADYISDLLAQSAIRVDKVRAWRVARRSPHPNLRRTARLIVVAEQEGKFVHVRARVPVGGERMRGFLVWQTLLLYLMLLGPIIAIAWRVAAPLRGLTSAARANPQLGDSTPIEEEGPSDVRELIRAFNAYQLRIATMLLEKDRMLGAVGHDLRTPLASLRVRIEAVEDAKLRAKMIASVEEMTAMLADILALARSGSGNDLAEEIDLAPFLSELAGDYRERGGDVALTGDATGTIIARPMLLRRAVRNLVDNALAYGVRARIAVERHGAMMHIIISDDGPGLTDAQVKTLVEPFARGEASRSRTTGGAGLGLSIARDIAENEGGTLRLANRGAHGLDATLLLPAADQA